MKNLILFLIFLLLSIEMTAQVVNYVDAKQTATSFFFKSDQTPLSLKSALVIKVDSFATYYTISNSQLKSTSISKEPTFYIFNRGDKPGFVIVSGDKRIREIIAYSSSCVFSDPNPGLKSLLNQYVQEISYAKQNNINANTIIYDYNLLSDGAWLLGQIQWNQNPDPYNTLCPPHYGSTHCPIGCQATVLGQILKYYKFPRTGYSSHSYTSNYGLESASFGTTDYNYELMPENPTPSLQNTQIATLLYHCGVSQDMNYATEGSGAPTSALPNALRTYFGYQANDKINKASYTWDAWKTIIKNEIDARRPVAYRGVDPGNLFNWWDSGAHIFIIDGYNNVDQYHVNWGWGSNGGNGYFLLTSLLSFTNDHEMIVNIEPKLPDLIPVGQSLSTTSVQAGLNLTAYCAEDNEGSISASANVVKVYLSPDDVLTPETNGDIYIDAISISGVAANTCSISYPKSITIPSNVSPGSYHVFFYADGGKVVNEVFEDNNFATAQLTVTAVATLNPPRNLSATAGNAQVILSWSAPSSGTPTSYTVYRSTSENGTYTTLTPNPTSLNYTAIGLTNGTTYWFKVKANYSSGSSDFTTAISAVSTSGIVYYPPRNLTATSGNGQVSLSWSAPSSGNPSSYTIYMGNSENGTYSFFDSSSTTSKTVTGLTNGSTYWFYVKAVYPSDISDPSNRVSALPKAAGSAPSNDNSGTPQPLAIKTSCSYESYTTINATPPSSDVPFYGSSTCTSLYKTTRYDDDVWFYIQPTSTSPVTITVNPTSNQSNFDIVLGLYSSSLSQIACGAKGDVGIPESVTFTPQANTPYLIRVFSYGEGSSYSGDFNICVTSSGGGSDCNITFFDGDDPANLIYANTEHSESLTIEGEPNCSFTVSESCSWLTVSLTSGTIQSNGQAFLDFYFDENPSTNQRQCAFNINGRPVTVTQDGQEINDDDFYITNVNVPSTILAVNGSVSVSCDQCYSGSKSDSELDVTNLGYYLSTNASFDSNDILLATDGSGLGSDDPCNSESAILIIPGNTTPGSYYILFVADHDKIYSESNESNNVAAVQISVNSASHDFYILNEAVYPDKLLATGLITIRCDLCYSGSSLDAEIGNCHVGYYFSTDKSFNSSSDPSIGSSITGIGSDNPIKDLSNSHLSIPTGTSPGIYYILLVADYDGRFVETNENNNVTYVQITVVGNSSSEDLYIQNSSISSSSVDAGGTIDVVCTQCYIGSTLDADMLSSVVGYYLSTNTIPGSANDIRLGTDASTIGSDIPFESESATLTIPIVTTPGTYYILFVADYDNRFTESNENNNVSYQQILVTGSQIPAISVSTTSLPDFGSLQIGSNSSPQNFTVSGSNLSSNIYLSTTGSDGFQISTSSSSGFGSTVTLTPSGGTVSSTPIYVQFSPSVIGYQTGNISITSSGATNKDVSMSGTGTGTPVPTITTSIIDLPDFGDLLVNTNSSPKSFTISGTNLTSNILFKSPEGFEISKSSDSGYVTSLTLTQSGGLVSNTTIYVRFSPTIAGFYRGNILLLSPDAPDENILVSGTGIGTLTYCSAGSASQDENIGYVGLGSISNASGLGVGGYQDGTSLSTTMQKGVSSSIEISLGNYKATDQILIWVDWNKDGDFTDSGENVYSTIGNLPNQYISSNFTPPSDATIGLTRMRIRLHDMVDGPNTTPCGNSMWGEVEDYSIEVTSCNTPAMPVNVSGSAAGQTTANLSWAPGSPAGSGEVSYYWVVGTSSNVEYGNGIDQGITTGTSATITDLSVGTTYYLRVYAKTSCDGSISDYKTSTPFATSISGGTPAANFSATTTNGCVPLTVNFTDESTGNPTSWEWDIDDDGTVDYTDQNPTHTYSNTGNYKVKLTVRNASGLNTITRTNYINASSNGVANVTIDVSPSSTIKSGQMATFTANPFFGGTGPYYFWMLDGSSVGSNSPTFQTSNLTDGQKVQCVMSSNSPCVVSTIAYSNVITMRVGNFISPELINWSPANKTISDNHPIFTMSFRENVFSGTGGNLKVFKVGTNIPVLTIPILSTMISGKDVIMSFSALQPGLDPNTNYYILVDGNALKDNEGIAFRGVSDANAWTFNTGSFTDVDPILDEPFNFKVYPNPVTNELTIELEGNTQKVDFEIINSLGQSVFSGVIFEKAVVQTTNFTPGIYLIKLKSGTTFEFKKIIKE
jgi:PKD repeat protein